MTRFFSKFTGLAALTLALHGCAYRLAGTPEECTALRQKNQQVLRQYFYSSVAEELEKIPIYYAEFRVNAPSARGDFDWLAAHWYGVEQGWVTLYNIEQKKAHQDQLFIHENIHHAQMLKKIDREKFKTAWNEMHKDLYGHKICVLAANNLAKYEGVIDSEDEALDELMSVIPGYILQYRSAVPTQMRQVYREVLHLELIADTSEEEKKKYQQMVPKISLKELLDEVK